MSYSTVKRNLELAKGLVELIFKSDPNDYLKEHVGNILKDYWDGKPNHLECPLAISSLLFIIEKRNFTGEELDEICPKYSTYDGMKWDWEMTYYDRWFCRILTNLGSFDTNLFKLYQIADKTNKEILTNSFPSHFQVGAHDLSNSRQSEKELLIKKMYHVQRFDAGDLEHLNIDDLKEICSALELNEKIESVNIDDLMDSVQSEPDCEHTYVSDEIADPEVGPQQFSLCCSKCGYSI